MLNPLTPLWLLRSPNLFALTITGFTTLMTEYVLLIPVAYTIGARYNIHNEALIGACFAPCGLGNMIASPIAGRLSDRLVVSRREKRGGKWYPEDRLIATFPGAIFLVPFSVLLSGIITHFMDGWPGLVLNLVCFFMNGLGVDFVLTPSASYVVDIMHSRSAESMAGNNGFRAMLMSMAIAGIFPMIETYGVLYTNIVSAFAAWFGCILLWCVVKYGKEMRAWVDVGYTTEDDI